MLAGNTISRSLGTLIFCKDILSTQFGWLCMSIFLQRVSQLGWFAAHFCIIMNHWTVKIESETSIFGGENPPVSGNMFPIYIYIYIHTYIHIYKKHDISNHINVLMINFDFKLSFGFLGKPFAGSDRVIKTYPVWMVMRRRYTTWFLGNMILHHRDHFQPTSLVYTSMVHNYNPYYNPILNPSIKIKHGKLPYFITIN